MNLPRTTLANALTAFFFYCSATGVILGEEANIEGHFRKQQKNGDLEVEFICTPSQPMENIIQHSCNVEALVSNQTHTKRVTSSTCSFTITFDNPFKDDSILVFQAKCQLTYRICPASWGYAWFQSLPCINWENIHEEKLVKISDEDLKSVCRKAAITSSESCVSSCGKKFGWQKTLQCEASNLDEWQEDQCSWEVYQRAPDGSWKDTPVVTITSPSIGAASVVGGNKFHYSTNISPDGSKCVLNLTGDDPTWLSQVKWVCAPQPDDYGWVEPSLGVIIRWTGNAEITTTKTTVKTTKMPPMRTLIRNPTPPDFTTTTLEPPTTTVKPSMTTSAEPSATTEHSLTTTNTTSLEPRTKINNFKGKLVTGILCLLVGALLGAAIMLVRFAGRSHRKPWWKFGFVLRSRRTQNDVPAARQLVRETHSITSYSTQRESLDGEATLASKLSHHLEDVYLETEKDAQDQPLSTTREAAP